MAMQTFEEFVQVNNPSVIFRGIVGSHAYGTANEHSDVDTRGIFVVPSAAYVRLQPPPTLFASVVGGLTLSFDQRQAIDRLLALKSGASEVDRILPDPCLDDLLQDRFEDLSQIKWPERSGGDLLPILTDLFRRCVKFN